MPPGTPVAQFFCEQWTELDTSLAEGLMVHLNAALVQQFLDAPITQWKAVVQPDGVLDDGYGEAVAVRLGIGYVGSAYPDPIKATQPFKEHGWIWGGRWYHQDNMHSEYRPELTGAAACTR